MCALMCITVCVSIDKSVRTFHKPVHKCDFLSLYVFLCHRSDWERLGRLMGS